MDSHSPSPDFWRKCSSCKNPIHYRADYWICNVSTCNRKRTGLVFCGVSCWDAHLPLMNHRESWAEERKAPSLQEWTRMLSNEDKPKRESRTKPPTDLKEKGREETSSNANSTPPRVILRRSTRSQDDT